MKSDRSVVAWGGLNQNGETTVPTGLTGVAAIAAGYMHTLALKTDGTVVAWGAGTRLTSYAPHLGQSMVPTGLDDVVAVAAGHYHSLALKRDGTVVAWGAGTSNSGDPNSLAYGQSMVHTGLTDVVAIAAGERHSLALKNDGTVVFWGQTQHGQGDIPPSLNILPNGSISPNFPQIVPLGSTTRFILTPKTGFTASVGGTCGGTLVGNTYTTGAVTADCSVVATFSEGGGITVTASVDAHGSLDKTSITVISGATASFTVTPRQGYTTDTAVGGNCPAGTWNGDGTLDLADAILGMEILSGMEKSAAAAADVDGDGRVGVADVIFLLRQLGR